MEKIPSSALNSFMSNYIFYYNLFLGLNVTMSVQHGHIILQQGKDNKKGIGYLQYIGYKQPHHCFKALIKGQYVYLYSSQDNVKMSLVALNNITPELDYDLLTMEANMQIGKPRSVIVDMKHYVNGKEDTNYGFINTTNNVAFRVKRDHDCESIINATDGTQVMRSGESIPLLSIFAFKYDTFNQNTVLTKKRYLTIRKCTEKKGSYYIKMEKMGKSHELKHRVYDINSSDQANMIISGLWDTDKVSGVIKEVREGLRGMINPDFLFYYPNLYFKRFDDQKIRNNEETPLNRVLDSLVENIYYDFNRYPIKYYHYEQSYVHSMLAGPKH